MEEKNNEGKVISFASDYKGKARDVFLIKAKQLCSSLGLGLALVLGGGGAFLLINRSAAPGGNDAGWMLVFFFLGIVVLLLSPLSVLLFKINNGYAKELRFAFFKREGGAYSFVLYTYKKEEPYSYEACVSSLKVKKTYVEMKDDKGEIFYFPFKAMKEEGVELIKQIAKETKELQTSNKKRHGRKRDS